MRLVLIGLFVGLLLVPAVKAERVAETEPNGSVKQANAFDPAQVITGVINSTDTDFFRFSFDDDQIRDIGFEFEKVLNTDFCLYTADGQKLKCSRSSLARFEGLRLNGEFLVSVSPVAKMAEPIAYQLKVGTPRSAVSGYEIEPNDRWEDAISIQGVSETKGTLVGRDYDVFKFSVTGARELMRIVVDGEAAASVVLRTAAGIELLTASDDNGQVRMDNLQLPQGDYALRITSNKRASEPNYTLTLSSFGVADSVDFDRLVSQPGASKPGGIIEAEPNNTNGQADRLNFGEARVGALTKSDTDMYWFYLSGHGRVRIEGQPASGGKMALALDREGAIRSSKEGETVVFEGELLPGDHYVRVRSRPAGSGLYKLTMTQLDPLEVSENKLSSVSITLAKRLPELAAYVSLGQQFDFNASITNAGSETITLEIIASSSAHSWKVQPTQAELILSPGETREISVDVKVLSDARADQPVLISLGARNAAGAVISESVLVNAQCDGIPVNAQNLWSIPEAFLGRVNAAFSGLGAEIVNPRRRDLDGIDGIVSRSTGAWGRKDDTVTIDLAGSTELTVLGVVLHPAGSGARSVQLKEFEILTSIDGKTFTSAFLGELSGDGTEQPFVFDARIKARFVQIRLINNYASNKGKIGFGELKVLVSESAHSILGGLVNIADKTLGGYDVYSNPFAGSASVRDQFSSSKSDGQYSVSADQYEWVMAFQDNRAARITELHWIDFPGSSRKELLLASVVVEVSMDSPLGPWEEIADWTLERNSSAVLPLKLDVPVWARYVRFVSPALEGDRMPYVPQQIKIYEQKAAGEYRSVLGEWGYTSRTAVFEYLNPVMVENASNIIDAADQREHATRLAENVIASGDVLVGEDVDWYVVTVPLTSNELTLKFSGNPVVEFAYTVEDESGTVLETGVGAHTDVELKLDVSPGRYFIKLFELPRSIIFAWDTSGSVGPFYDVIDQTMKAFASGVHAGREEVNLQPFSDPDQKFLLDDWSGDTGVVLSAIVNSDRKFSSSNVESSLLFSSRELLQRQGARAVLLITDAETDGYKLTGDLWASLAKSRPRVFSFEISSAGSNTAQNQMQSYAEINNGFYDQALSAGDLQVGFDRAICMLRRPKQYHIGASFDKVPEKPDGFLLVELDASEAGVEDAVEVILDASGSMYQKLDGRFRYQIAKDVLDDLVASTLPDNIGFALRVFGNRDPSSCRTDLEIELGPLDRSAARTAIQKIEPQQFAYTPIAASLARVASDLESVKGRRTVVLVTDGEESCDGDVEAAIENLKKSGVDVQLNVIGFDFDAKDKEVLRGEFREWAKLGGGSYFDATNASELARSLTEAVKTITHYDVETVDGDIVIGGVEVGETVAIRPGTYRVKVPGTIEADRPKIVIRSAKTTAIQLKP